MITASSDQVKTQVRTARGAGLKVVGKDGTKEVRFSLSLFLPFCPRNEEADPQATYCFILPLSAVPNAARQVHQADRRAAQEGKDAAGGSDAMSNSPPSRLGGSRGSAGHGNRLEKHGRQPRTMVRRKRREGRWKTGEYEKERETRVERSKLMGKGTAAQDDSLSSSSSFCVSILPAPIDDPSAADAAAASRSRSSLRTCTPWCRESWSGRANRLPHPGYLHPNGFSPVCVRT